MVRASEPLGSEGLWDLRSVPGGSESLDSKIVKSVSMTSRDLRTNGMIVFCILAVTVGG